MRFGVSLWRESPHMNTAEGVLKFFEECHNFIENSLNDGKNVMVHCMAGAHRAGTAGVSYMMKAA
jgi:protein-tyrosine phosphatase